MPEGVCEGPPDRGCPNKRTGIGVHFEQGDIWLCSDCKDVRFGDNTQLKQPLTQTRSQRDRISINGYPGDGRSNDGVREDGRPQSPQVIDDVDHNVADPETDNIIEDPVLAYILFSQQSGTAAKVRMVATAFFSIEQITQAKDRLWEKSDPGVLGENPRRKDSASRSEKDAHVGDIIVALSKLDKSEKMPRILINALDLGFIPRSHPEELNNITLADRLNQQEARLEKLQESNDRIICENMVIMEKIQALPGPPSWAQVTSGPSTMQTGFRQPTVQERLPVATTQPPHAVQPPHAIGVNGRGTLFHVPAPVPPAPLSGHNAQRPSYPRGRGGSQLSTRGRGFNRGGGHASSYGERGRSQSTDRASTTSNVSRNANWNDLAHSTDNDWEVVSHQRKQRRPRKVITGAKSQTGGFKGAPTPSRSIFIYRVSKDTELNELRTYIADLVVKDIQYLDCVSHVDAKFQSFKLTVPCERLYRAVGWISMTIRCVD